MYIKFLVHYLIQNKCSKTMVVVLPEGNQGLVTIDLISSRQMKQTFLITSALPNNVPLYHRDSRMAVIK